MAVVRPYLVPLVPFYAVGVVIRNWFFDMGILRTAKAGVPVVSVGNLDSGGAGKTPLVEFLARRLALKGRKVAIVSRGYRRTTSGTVVVSDGSAVSATASASGDEPAQMAAKLTGVRVVVDEARFRGAQHAVSKLGADVILLDDGFQHRYLHRDIDIVVIPADRAADAGWMLPAGNRREPLGSLERATLIAVSRCQTMEHFHAAKQALGEWSKKPVIGLTTRISAVRRATTKFSVDLAGLKGKSAIAFSGIGDPASFERTVSGLGVELKSHMVFPDHHDFAVSELHALEDSLKAHAADYLLTTEKDVVRLSSADGEPKEFLERTPSFYIEIEQQIIDGEAALNQLLERI